MFSIELTTDIEPEESQQPTLKRFSFQQAQETLKEYHGSLSDAVLEERKDDDLLLPMNMIRQKQVFQPNSKVKL